MFEEKIKDFLKFIGLDEGLAKKIKVEKEEDIPSACVKYAMESEADRRASKAVETREEALKTEFAAEKAELEKKLKSQNTTTDGQGAGGGEGAGAPDMAEVIRQAVEAATKPLMDRVSTIETTGIETNRKTLIRDALKEAGLSESMAKYVNVDDDAKIGDAVEALKADLKVQRQTEIDNAIDGTTDPLLGGVSGSTGENIVADFAKAQSADKKEGGLVSEFIEKSKK